MLNARTKLGSGRFGRTAGWFVGALLLAILAAVLAGLVAEQRAEGRALERMRVDAQLRAALLTSEVARFRLLPLALAGDRDVAAALSGDPPARSALNRKLEALAKETGAAVVYVLDAQGRAIAASNWRNPTSFVGQDYAFRSYFQGARRSGSAAQFALGTISAQPGLYLARRTPNGGVIVVKLEFDRLERQWSDAAGHTYVHDDEGVVLVTSNPQLRFTVSGRLAPEKAARLRDEFRLGGEALRPLPVGPPSLSVAVPTQVEDWQLVHTLPRAAAVGGAVWLARVAGAAAMLALLAGVAVVIGRARRRGEAQRAEAVRTAELEAAVVSRTAELRHEIEERQASEARAATLREGLRQANRLATLGQVTAGVAHETAQPVAAIRTFAANGERLLLSGATEEVRRNLQAIGRLADRIGTITAELRDFARKAPRPVEPVSLAGLIEGALLILKEKLRAIEVVCDKPPPDLQVLGGRVRLEQVLVNLLQNAAEALEGRLDPRISIIVEPGDERVRILVADNGPGIAPDLAERLFTPFATSRASGLGLGLVISQDIAHDLGGTLRLLPGEGGACFELILRRVP